MGCKHNYVFTQGYFYCTKCGRKHHGELSEKKRGKTAGIVLCIAVVGTVGLFFINGIFEFNQDNLDRSLQNMPQSLQDAGKAAQDIASETSDVLRETINEQLDDVQLEPADMPIKEISELPKTIKENSPIKEISELPRTIQENNPLNKKPKVDQAKLELLVHELTNQYREKHDLKPLSWDDDLANVARGHSLDMAQNAYFSHDNLEGQSPTDRAASKGYSCEKVIGNLIYHGIAENIFQNNLYDTVWYTNGIPTSYEWNTQGDIAQTTVDGWMDSPGHRKNILTETYDREGIGVAIAQDDKVYITQNFC